MLKEIVTAKEKKVEYVELIYDLIFVYIIGRNNLLLHNMENGFISANMFIAYIICTLAIIQIWNYTTYYINIYGRNGVRDHVFMFVNMFLIYFMADGIRENWQGYQTQYHAAWALILINIGIQYILEMRNRKYNADDMKRLRRMTLILFTEAALVFLSIPVYRMTGNIWLPVAAIMFGIILTTSSGKKNKMCAEAVDFSHLSERAMLYVVFTFGEMIIAIASYFEGEPTANNVYFCAMAFLIVVGLFLGYELMYDHIVDREARTDGLLYMLIHIFMIFSLNNITAALEFMHDDEVSLMPKMLFLILSFIIYYVSLFSIGRYSKASCKQNGRYYGIILIAGIIFIGLMILFRNSMHINIAITVVYVFSVAAYMYVSWKRTLSCQK